MNAEYEKVQYLLEYHREQIKRMSPLDFEIFVADIFKKLGFSIKITQKTRDAPKFAEERENLMALWDIDNLLKLAVDY